MYSMRDYEYDKQKQQKKSAPENAVVLQSEVDDVDSIEAPTREKLKRDIKAEALERLEQAARTPEDFEEVIEWWDRIDRNRERRERYREISRSDDFPIETGAALGTNFATNLYIAKQICKGEFLEAIFDSPQEIQEHISEKYLFEIIRDLKPEHKELLYMKAIQRLDNTQIAKIRGQTDRNIRERWTVLLRKLHKKIYSYLTSEEAAQHHNFTITERAFVEEYELQLNIDKIKNNDKN